MAQRSDDAFAQETTDAIELIARLLVEHSEDAVQTTSQDDDDRRPAA